MCLIIPGVLLNYIMFIKYHHISSFRVLKFDMGVHTSMRRLYDNRREQIIVRNLGIAARRPKRYDT